MSDRQHSPEFSEDYERVAAVRRRAKSISVAADADLVACEDAGRVAAWRAFPNRARLSNPHAVGTAEHAAWHVGVESSWAWAQIHVEEGWHRVVDGREVMP